MMSVNEALIVLRARETTLKRSLSRMNGVLKRNQHKSRHCRMTGELGQTSARIGFYTDHLQELQLIIRFLEGREKAEYLTKGGDGVVW